MDHEERKRSPVSVTSFRIVNMAFFTLKINNLSLRIKLFAFQIEYLRIINHKRKAMNQKCYLNTSCFVLFCFFSLQHSAKWLLHWNESSDNQHKRLHLSSLFTAKSWLWVLIHFRTWVYRDNKNIERYVTLLTHSFFILLSSQMIHLKKSHCHSEKREQISFVIYSFSKHWKSTLPGRVCLLWRKDGWIRPDPSTTYIDDEK